MTTRPPRAPCFSPLVLLSACFLGCPGRGDSLLDAAAASSSTLPTHVSSSSIASTPTTSVESSAHPEEALRSLQAGVAPSIDRAADGELAGIEVHYRLTPSRVVAPPLQLGALPIAIATARGRAFGELTVQLAAGRMRARSSRGAFGLLDGVELRADRLRPGFVLILPGTPARFRVVPPGALRTMLNEGRADALPLAFVQMTTTTTGVRLGRSTERETISTPYGSIDLEQLVVAPKRPEPRPAPSNEHLDRGERPDARAPEAGAEPQPLDGSGEPLCRALLELLLADRAAGGAPCRADRVPLFAELSYVGGGGLTIEADQLRELPIPSAALALLPLGAQLAGAAGFSAAIDAPRALLDADPLTQLRARGELGALELVNRSLGPRIALLDGAPIALLPAGRELPLRVRASRYLLEWRTPIGEASEPPLEIGAPGRVLAGQEPAAIARATP